METSTEINEIAGALATAQAGLGKLIADRTVKNRDGTPRYTYANLADALESCRATLNAHGIAILQEVTTPEGSGIEVRTMLVHNSGQWIRSAPLFMPVSGGAQDVGSAITYARRYQLLGMVGLAPEDDDGAAAQNAKPDSWGQRNQKAQPKRDAVGPRCRGKLAHISIENEKLMRELSEAEGISMGDVWDKLLELCHVDYGQYVTADGTLPQTASDLSRNDGEEFKKQARGWLLEVSRG